MSTLLPISATRTIATDPETAFLFLGDLENHWELADRFVRVVRLDGPRTARDRGEIVVRGPMGLRRRVRTVVVAQDAPHRIEGLAHVGRRTAVRITWSLRPDPEGSRVELTATELSLGRIDRLLLAAGGRLWLRHRFAVTLERLAEQLAVEHPATVSGVPVLAST